MPRTPSAKDSRSAPRSSLIDKSCRSLALRSADSCFTQQFDDWLWLVAFPARPVLLNPKAQNAPVRRFDDGLLSGDHRNEKGNPLNESAIVQAGLRRGAHRGDAGRDEKFGGSMSSNAIHEHEAIGTTRCL